jgi:hypothetical protein
MSFQAGKPYTRLQISGEFCLPEDQHAVIMSGGVVKAIVVAKNGRHPSGKQYKNVLTAEPFQMHGEYDGNYSYEGEVRWTRTDDWEGEPFRNFDRE